MFAIGGWTDAGIGVVFKAGELVFEALRDAQGFRPAPYMASRGLCWLQHVGADGPDEDVLDPVRASYGRVVAGLPRAKRPAGDLR